MTQASKPWRQLEWLSEDTLLLSFDDPLTPATAAMLASLVENLQRTQPAWLWDLTPGFGKLLVHYRPNLIHSAALEHALAEALAAPVDSLNSNTDPALEIPVCYDARVAPDLEQVAVQTGLSIEAVIALHCSVEYRVLAVGFALGFAYLGTLPDGLRLPR
ncbi:MAG: carboxyltransferase domain-containing protein, partial [Gammaproteobacteria bacterium]|nr:carboxyltransferase domain-containing protein [Gammaproteobacteria bacterium]